jgi:type IV secretion system protein VirD4
MDYHSNHHGTAQFADYEMIERAGLYRAKQGLFLGFDDRGRILRSDTMAAVFLQGGARSGKGDHIIPWLVDGHYNDHVINMDWKGQNGAVSQLQVLQGRHVVNFAPRGGAGIVAHRINPVAYLNSTSLTLIPDATIFASNFVPFSGSLSGEYFEATAQRWTKGVAVTLARITGQVTLPQLSDLMALFASPSDEWLSFEERMTEMPESFIQGVVEDCRTMTESDNSNAGGFTGAKGELAKAFACMADPQLREALSPPYSWCISELTKENCTPTVLNIMEEMHFSESSAPVIKSIYSAAYIYKTRHKAARRQVWCLDEVGNIKSWPFAVTLATAAAGYGIRAIYVIQSRAQLNNLAPNAGATIPNSCGTQIIKGIRSDVEAIPVSRMLGTATIQREDFNNNRSADEEAWNHYWQALNGEADSWEAACTHERVRPRATHTVTAPRPLRTTDELLSTNDRKAFVFMSGTLERPAKVHVPQYWTRRDLAGRFLEDPYHSNGGKVSVRGMFGQRNRRVITQAVPAKYSAWPQYANGTWSFVDGYRPK